MHDEPIFSAPLEPLTADVAELCAADRLDIAARVYELAVGQVSEIDFRMAGALLDAPWEQVAPEDVGAGTSVLETVDVAEMIAEGHANAGGAMWVAYVQAECERKDIGASDVNEADLWMAGVLLEAVSESAGR